MSENVTMVDPTLISSSVATTGTGLRKFAQSNEFIFGKLVEAGHGTI
jgi:hypothetical protein